MRSPVIRPRAVARQRRRQALFLDRMGRASRPVEQFEAAAEYLRGALADATPDVAGREVDALVRVITDAVARLHQHTPHTPRRTR